MGMSEVQDPPAYHELDAAGHNTVLSADHIDDSPERMDSYRAVGLAEGFIEGSAEEQHAAWTYLIETGQVWNLQGWFGRQAISLMAMGVVKIPDGLSDRLRADVERERQNSAISEYFNN